MDSAWRLHISNSAIAQIDWVPGKPALLGVWLHDDRVSFYAQDTGTHHTDLHLTLPAPSAPAEVWTQFMAGLKAPNLAVLPRALVAGARLWPVDGGAALMIYRGGPSLSLLRPDQVTQNLTFDVTPLDLIFDPSTLTAVAVDGLGSVMLGTLTGSVRTVKPGLALQPEMNLRISAAAGLSHIAISDGQHLFVLDSEGKTIASSELSYLCGEMAIFPDGKHLLTYDGDSRVLRAYSTDDLSLVGQRFITDLLGAARKTQLIADAPPRSAAVSALACAADGVFAFAVMGHVCAATLELLRHKPVTIHPPKPQAKPTKAQVASDPKNVLTPNPVVKAADTKPVSVIAPDSPPKP